MQLRVIVVPVSDLDRAKGFYLAMGFREDLDHRSSDDFRVVELTPPGDGASIVLATAMTDALPGSVRGLHLIVPDIETARDDLIIRGIDVGEVFHDVGGVYYRASPAWEIPGVDPGGRDRASFARFSDPDGNGWVLQGSRTRGHEPAG
jgi:catechol 2,3-dioxygenase-like lactoylglutathione lyase family enzyme